MISCNQTQYRSSAILLLATMVLATLLQSCIDLPDPKPSSNGLSGADFTMEEVTGDAKIEHVYTHFSVPDKKLFNFRTCLKDVGRDEPLLGGLKFAIRSGDFEIPVQTQESGCISWSETLSYQHFADSRYVTLERTLISKNKYSGTIPFQIAVNPWLHGENSLSAVLDPRHHSIPELIAPEQTLFVLTGRDNTSPTKKVETPLIIEEARLVITEKRMTEKGVVLEVEVVTQPMLHLTRMDGQIHEEPITSGKFKINGKILSIMEDADQKAVRTQLSQDREGVSATMIGGRLRATMELTLPYVPTRGNLEMWLAITPEDGPEGLQGSEGIYHLGEYHQLKGSPFVRLKPSVAGDTASFDINNYVTQKAEALTKDTRYFVKAQYVFDPLTIRFVRYGKETATEREVIFTAYTCVTNSIDNRRARAYEFTVEKLMKDDNGKPQTEKLRTLDNGCFQWTDSIRHKYFVREQLMIGDVTIKNEELAVNQDIGIAINPWDFGFTFGRDTRLMSEADLTDESYREKPKSEFYLNGFKYTTIGVDFEIDRLLNLRLYRRLVFRIDPYVLRYHSMTMGRNGIEYLRDGVYLVKLALQRNGYEDPLAANDYISSVEKLVQVVNNQIITPVEFGFDDVRLLGSRNNLLVELATVREEMVRIFPSGDVEPLSPVVQLDDLIDTESGLDPKTFIGPIILHNEDDGKALMSAQNQSLLDLLAETTNRSEPEERQAIEEATQKISKSDEPDESLSDSATTATELIKQGKAKRTERERLAREAANIDTFLFENDLLLVDLNGDTHRPLIDALTIDKKDAAAPQPRTPQEAFDTILRTGSLSTTQAAALCDFWFREHLPMLFPERTNLFSEGQASFALIPQCAQTVDQQGADEVFIIERRLHIEEVGPHRYIKGFALNFNFGTSFGLSKSASESVSTSYGTDVSAGPKVFGVGGGAYGGIRFSKDSSEQSAVRVDMSSATFLVTEQNDFEITINKYKQCFGIKLSPSLIFGEDAPWRNIWPSELTGVEKAFSVTAGYYICDGKVIEEPRLIRERFYYNSQHFAVGNLQDSRDLRNRQFLLALRGVRDHSLFMNAIEAQPYVPESSAAGGFNQQLPLEALYPVFQMQKYHPGFPGTYLVLPPDPLTK